MTVINIHIGRLVMDGISVANHRQPMLDTAIETELTRLFCGDTASIHLLSSADLSHIPESEIGDVDETNPAQIGRQIARVIYEGINR